MSPSRRAPSLTATTIALVLALTGLAGCSADPEGTPDGPDATTAAGDGTWPRTVDSLDGAGQKTSVEIPAQPKKVVSASVTLTGALLAIDAPVAATGGAKANSAIADRNGFLLQWADVAERKGVKSLSQTPTAPDAEKIAAEQPDLIVASAAGADSAAAVHDQLSAIAPTIVIDYTNQSWQSVTEHLGRATGHESEATTAIDEVASRADEVKNRVGEPEQPINIVLPLPTGGLNFLTPESAQGNLITAMGWQVAVPTPPWPPRMPRAPAATTSRVLPPRTSRGR